MHKTPNVDSHTAPVIIAPLCPEHVMVTPSPVLHCYIVISVPQSGPCLT